MYSLIKRLNNDDGAMVMSEKIKDFWQAFQNVANDEPKMKESFISFNNYALKDPTFGINLAIVISASFFDDSFIENGSSVRAEMLNTLKRNYKNAEHLRTNNIKHFYNSITMLGEYYNRCGMHELLKPLASALFELLLNHLESNTNDSLDSSHIIDEEFAKLIFTQVKLNGRVALPTHKTEIDSLLFAIRKCFIEVSQLSSNVKTYFVITLDLFHSKFGEIPIDNDKLLKKLMQPSPVNQVAKSKSSKQRRGDQAIYVVKPIRANYNSNK